MEKKRVIVDCDAGIDDAVALMILTTAHKLSKVDLLGITCVNGNTVIDNVVTNVFRTLQACDSLDIPVYKGAYAQFLDTENAKIAANELFHGADGLGDVFQHKPDVSRLKKEHAVHALNRIVSENPGEISIICLGPLTNIALAIRMYPEFIGNVKDLYIMGGNYTGQGNITSQAEFNFFADPESAHVVLANATKPYWILPWETCLKAKISPEWRYSVFGELKTSRRKFVDDIENGIWLRREKKGIENYSPCDAFLAAIFLRPDMAVKTIEHHADVELSGLKTRGQVVLDHLKLNKPNVKIIVEVDTEIFKNLMLFGADPNNYSEHIL